MALVILGEGGRRSGGGGGGAPPSAGIFTASGSTSVTQGAWFNIFLKQFGFHLHNGLLRDPAAYAKKAKQR